jgi:hydroxyacylglutathione hydrolase
MKIAEDLYFYPWESYTQNNSNSIMISGSVKTLIDPGHKQLFDQLADQLREDGVPPENIDMVIHTHCHPDHMEAGEILGGYGAKQAIHPDDEAYFRKIGPEFYKAMGLEMPNITIDVGLVEGDLTLGRYHPAGLSHAWTFPGQRLLVLARTPRPDRRRFDIRARRGPDRFSRRQRPVAQGKHH